jgi:anti-sigma regulatory factor (Ser/Thr protein kinase)
VGAQASIDTTIANSLSEIPRVARMVDSLGAAHDLSPDVIYDLQLALEEILTNVMTHGSPHGRSPRISIRLTVGQGMVTAEILDDGEPFNPLEAPRPNLSANLRDRPVGGVGILFVRELMDEVEYERVDNWNRLALKRYTRR